MTKKVSVLLTTSEFARLKAYCTERGFKKSTLLARLIRDHLDGEKYPDQSALEFAREPAADYGQRRKRTE